MHTPHSCSARLCPVSCDAFLLFGVRRHGRLPDRGPGYRERPDGAAMKSSVFSALVWCVSSGLIRLHAASLSGSGHMLRTLRGWAIAALVISLAMRLLPHPACAEETSLVRQVRAAFSAFALFSVFVATLMVLFASVPPRWATTFLTFLGGVLVPVMAITALEFPDLRPRALAAGAVMAGGLAGCALFSVSVLHSVPRPGIIRTEQPAKAPRHSTAAQQA